MTQKDALAPTTSSIETNLAANVAGCSGMDRPASTCQRFRRQGVLQNRARGGKKETELTSDRILVRLEVYAAVARNIKTIQPTVTPRMCESLSFTLPVPAAENGVMQTV